MSHFDTVCVMNWSSASDRGRAPIWSCKLDGTAGEEAVCHRNRQYAGKYLEALIANEIASGRRLLLGFDFPFGYPEGTAKALTGQTDPFQIWDLLARLVNDTPMANNRFEVAGFLNRRIGSGKGPFWFNGLKCEIDGLPRDTKGDYHNPFPKHRLTERLARGTFSCWQIGGAGSVGGQIMTGLPVLKRLRDAFPGKIAVWPFEPLACPVTFVEIWRGLRSLQVASVSEHPIKDARQVQGVARAIAGMPREGVQRLLDVKASEEGWIFGVEQTRENPKPAVSGPSVSLRPPPLLNDCFALPRGVRWTPVDEALGLLRARMEPVTGVETVPLVEAAGRVLASDMIARCANPPHTNSAVDGFGFGGGLDPGPHILDIVGGRAAAGESFTGHVPAGSTLLVLTGAELPKGVDTVVLREDATLGDGRIAINGPLKRGANTRQAGEDLTKGQMVLAVGHVLTPSDMALVSAAGLAEALVRIRLRVAVLSTGNELVEPGADAGSGQIFDANRPMLLALVARLGFRAIDMGRVGDDRSSLRARLDAAADCADVIVTSGGASAGDEDHVSALLREQGAMQTWRVAVKPGRPLALGLWNGKPVFGLPGNPVAAFVCALVFARPAMGMMAGIGWHMPQQFKVPAAFDKHKRPGRREYLRARLRGGRAEVFRSEGSGLISGLSWADGLVELDDGERRIRPDDPVAYVPYSSFFEWP